MRKIRAWVALTLVAALAVAACGGDSDDESNAGQGGQSDATAAAFDESAVIRMASSIPLPTVDPHLAAASATSIHMLTMIYDPLLLINGDRELLPGLATEWETSADGKTITLQIREGITFGDGTDVNAEAVRASLLRGKGVDGSGVQAQLANVVDVTASDDYTVEITLEEPNSTFLYSLADFAGLVISPKALESGVDLAASDHGAGSGPFQVKDFRPPDRLVLEKRPGAEYWDDEAYRYQGAEFTNVGDPNVILNGLRSGQFDVAKVGVSAEEAERKVGPGFEVSVLQSDTPRAMMLRNTRPPFDRAEVREALAHAVGWEAIATQVLDDRYTYAEQLVPEGHPAYIDGYTPFEHRSDEAPSVLDGLSFTAVVGANLPDENKIAPVVQQQLAEVGMDMNIEARTTAEAVSEFAKGNFDVHVIAFVAKPDFAMTVHDRFLGNDHLAHPDDEERFRSAISEANSDEIGSDERADALAEVSKVAHEEYVLIPIAFLGQNYVYKDGISGIDESMGGVFNASSSGRYWTVASNG